MSECFHVIWYLGTFVLNSTHSQIEIFLLPLWLNFDYCFVFPLNICRVFFFFWTSHYPSAKISPQFLITKAIITTSSCACRNDLQIFIIGVLCRFWARSRNLAEKGLSALCSACGCSLIPFNISRAVEVNAACWWSWVRQLWSLTLFLEWF